jgi:hypothetical protein
VASHTDWSDTEIDAIVRDYFWMLAKERRGQHYVKAQHRRDLLPLLDGRSHASVEMKHCNISAVLDELGHPYINGYKPRKNLQEALRIAVCRFLQTSPASLSRNAGRRRSLGK